jgi:hypothetical protein
MSTIAIGVDLPKSVFQVREVDGPGQVRRRRAGQHAFRAGECGAN